VHRWTHLYGPAWRAVSCAQGPRVVKSQHEALRLSKSADESRDSDSEGSSKQHILLAASIVLTVLMALYPSFRDN